MAKIAVVNKADHTREILVNGIPIPDVMSLSLNIEPGSVDTAMLYIHSDEFKTINEERRTLKNGQSHNRAQNTI